MNYAEKAKRPIVIEMQPATLISVTFIIGFGFF